MDIIDAATSYASMGFLVFPARLTNVRNDLGELRKVKQPLLRHGHLQASNDPIQVEMMFRGMHEHNKPGSRTAVPDIIGMVHDRFLVIDVDVKNPDKPGRENFEKHVRPHLPKPLAKVETSSGGFHWYYPPPPKKLFSKRDIDKFLGVDFLIGKGWVAVPPSSGYRFITGSMETIHEALDHRS